LSHRPTLHAVLGGLPEANLQAYFNPPDCTEIEGDVLDSPGLTLPQDHWV